METHQGAGSWKFGCRDPRDKKKTGCWFMEIWMQGPPGLKKKQNGQLNAKLWRWEPPKPIKKVDIDMGIAGPGVSPMASAKVPLL